MKAAVVIFLLLGAAPLVARAQAGGEVGMTETELRRAVAAPDRIATEGGMTMWIYDVGAASRMTYVVENGRVVSVVMLAHHRELEEAERSLSRAVGELRRQGAPPTAADRYTYHAQTRLESFLLAVVKSEGGGYDMIITRGGPR